MRQPLTAYGLVLVVFRLVGVGYLAWWVAAWFNDIHYVFLVIAHYDWDFGNPNIDWQQVIPAPFRGFSLSNSSQLLDVSKIGLAIYFTFAGRRLARFIARGTDRDGCPKCGYSLVGLKGDRCPECGEPLTPKVPKAKAPSTENP